MIVNVGFSAPIDGIGYGDIEPVGRQLVGYDPAPCRRSPAQYGCHRPGVAVIFGVPFR